MKKTRFFFFGEFSSLLSDIYILCYGFIKSTVYLSVKKYPSKINFLKSKNLIRIQPHFPTCTCFLMTLPMNLHVVYIIKV